MAAPDTPEVFNQSPPYRDVDLFGADRPLRDAVTANGAAAETTALSEFGRRWGSAEMLERGRLANESPPKLRAFDATGARCDTVEFHPAYHELMTESIGAGLHASTWRGDGTPAAAPAEVARAARYYMVAQVENGHMCPVTMTRAAVAALAAEPALAARLMPKILTNRYDPRFEPWWGKAGITLGMGMTEKQGGTDVHANVTRAVPSGDEYRLTGHKWFMSAPMCDGFLVLAQAPGGLTCFLLPRFCPDGSVNRIEFQRLKDKLGNRSNASSEVEFRDASAVRIGEEGGGVRTILQMVQLTRIDCAVASGGLMRAALARAMHHCRHRAVFQRRLIDQPMMRAVLSDMALEVEAVVALVMRLCRAVDLAQHDAAEAARARVLIPAVKYWVCKRAPGYLYEAMECLGGNGYVEDGTLARLYREAPVNAIWEGSGNVMCLDVLRAFKRNAEAARAVVIALGREAADLPGVAALTRQIEIGTAEATAEADGRIFTERLALLASIAAVKACAPQHVAEAFARNRLAAGRGVMWGSVELDKRECADLLDRASMPA
jgi:putative acyl-CoA dehydrogenase